MSPSKIIMRMMRQSSAIFFVPEKKMSQKVVKRVRVKQKVFPTHDDLMFIINTGSPGSGKTLMGFTFLDALDQKGVPRFVVFTGNRSVGSKYLLKVPPLYIHTLSHKTIKSELQELQMIMDKQDDVIAPLRQKFDAEERRKQLADPAYVPEEYIVPVRYRIGTVFDDVNIHKSFVSSNEFLSLFCEYRQLGIEIYLTLHDLVHLPRNYRINSRCVISMRITDEKSYKRMWEEFVGDGVCSYKEFYYVLQSVIQTPGCGVVCDKLKTVPKMYCTQSTYPPDPRIVGHEKYKAYSERHFLSEEYKQELRDQLKKDIKDDYRHETCYVEQLKKGPIKNEYYTHSLIGNTTEQQFEDKHEIYKITLELDN